MSKLTCPVCGNQHDDLPNYSFEGPAIWSSASAEEKAHFQLGPDLCRYKDEHFLIRGMLQIPIIDDPDNPLAIVAWTAISKENWWRYRTVFMDFNATGMGVFYGWLANGIPGYEDTINLKVEIRPRGPGLRPALTVIEAPDHPLFKDQLGGFTIDQAMRYLHEHGGF